ncbi:MAG: hypothetical protein CL910_20790 [Deltaproteobacteria bacterium]|nr:hypothetical protein [Deltaproteobacteria bacterium]
MAMACLIGVAHAQLPPEPRHARQEGFLPDPAAARLASFGFDALLADFYWLQAVQIAGGSGSPVGQSHRLGALLDLVTQLDPWVDHPYRFAALWMTDDEAAVRKANALLHRSFEYHPDDWRNRFYLAFNHYYYLGEDAEAAAVLEPAIDLPRAPRYLGRLVARLRSQEEGLETSAAFLQELVRRAPDEYAKAGYLRALDEIETERRARILDRAQQVFRERQGRELARVEELVTVPPAVLRRLPPEPHGSVWELDGQGTIVSAELRYRYRPKIDGTSRGLIQQFREKSQTGRGDS